jgi:DNA-binding NarL/FixJ family response regulator
MMKILIVDDHTLIKAALADLLAKHQFEVVAEASSSNQATELINTHKPEIVLVDINLGANSGVDLIKQMKRSGDASEFVVLTMHDDNQTLESAKAAGAVAFVTKSAPTQSLLEILHTVATGSDKFLKASKINKVTEAPDFNLTPRELEVLALLPTGATANAIGGLLFLSESTVKIYLANIYRKLSASNRARAVSIALESKLITN